MANQTFLIILSGFSHKQCEIKINVGSNKTVDRLNVVCSYTSHIDKNRFSPKEAEIKHAYNFDFCERYKFRLTMKNKNFTIIYA